MYCFEGYTSLFGICEEMTDVFYVIASDFSLPPDYYGYEGSLSIFIVDLRNPPDPTISQSAMTVSKAVDVPEAQLFSGLVIMNQLDGLLISGGVKTGPLYVIDMQKHTANTVLY